MIFKYKVQSIKTGEVNLNLRIKNLKIDLGFRVG